MRVPLLAGNWKMNKLSGDLETFFSGFAQELALSREGMTGKIDLLFAVPFLLLERAHKLAEPFGIRIAAQNVHFETSGAFTGEISMAMLKDIGITATLIGHSERRQYFAETDATVAKKVRAALAQDVLAIACVGETLEERERDETDKVVARQVNAVLEAVENPALLVLAYEPVWAIGTGRSATSDQAEAVHRTIRALVEKRFGNNVAQSVRIIYGGSANPANIKDLMTKPNIDGGLVGGASLKPADFAAMVRNIL